MSMDTVRASQYTAKKTIELQHKITDRQTEIHQKQLLQDQQRKNTGAQAETESKKVTRIGEHTANAAQIDPQNAVQTKSNARFIWENHDGELELKPNPKESIMTSTDFKTDGKQILRSLGIKIDLTARKSEIIESFMQTTKQSRHHNGFVSRYNAFKAGIMGQILSRIGMSQDDIQKLQKQALESLKDENIEMMAENIYNQELVELIYGKSRKAKKELELFNQLIQQLRAQMTKIGLPDYWSEKRILEEKMVQAKKIREEFLKEAETLTYQLDYMGYKRGVQHET